MKTVAPRARLALVLALSAAAYAIAPVAAFADCATKNTLTSGTQVSHNDPTEDHIKPQQDQSQVAHNDPTEDHIKPQLAANDTPEPPSQVAHNDPTEDHIKPQFAAIDPACQ